MPRNGQGVYSLPPVYEAVTGETIEAQQHNVPLEDLAADANNARPISTGGTGAQSATQARENFDVYSKAESTQAAIDAVGELAAKETPVDADSVVLVDSADDNKPKKTLWSKVKALVNTASVGAAVAAANGKATPADGDFFGGVLAGGSTMFKTTWWNIKSALAAIHYTKTEVNNIVSSGMAGRAYPRRSDGQDFNLNGSTALAQSPPAIIGGGWEGNFNNFYFYSTNSLRVAYAASSGDVGGYSAAQLRSYSEDRGYWRTQDYLVERQAGWLATYCLAYWTGSGYMNPNSWVEGSALRSSSAWGNSSTPAFSGSWVCMGFCDSNTQTSRVTVFFRRA